VREGVEEYMAAQDRQAVRVSIAGERCGDGYGYQWELEVPFLQVPPSTLMSNMTHEWSVWAPARPEGI
jgi:hypothetical protein